MRNLSTALLLTLAVGLGGCESSEHKAQAAATQITSMCEKNYSVPAQEAACEHGAYIGVTEVAKMQGLKI